MGLAGMDWTNLLPGVKSGNGITKPRPTGRDVFYARKTTLAAFLLRSSFLRDGPCLDDAFAWRASGPLCREAGL